MTRILYFTAPWCVPCRKFGPMLDVQARARDLPVQRLDIDEDAAGRVALALDVQSVPTVIVESDGEVVDRFGALSPIALRDRLEAACGR
ncbi:thioredoxin 1 [Micromonospora sp. M71_S20]|uniref:thioredoxin family protein n=1 Tax=Micromonospora sp. M71_S20 TaxID=592872 RepID=UPI000EABE639|nr:thioredoxin family protein [Micromonospora sp. M71_S20]RLK22668.1 thioredoxin 1 [Micromonospora sp. M71_S20]